MSNRPPTAVILGVLGFLAIVCGLVTMLALSASAGTERVITFLGTVLPFVGVILTLGKVSQQGEKVDQVADDVAQVKHQTNGAMDQLATQTTEKLDQIATRVEQAVRSPDGMDQRSEGRHADDRGPAGD